MRQLVCEMCDGTDFVKQDGMFVCQSCGCKYSVEEARKLMSSANNPSPGVDNTKLQNLLNLAHSSYESNNYAQAEEFCNQVIAMDGTNYDAWKLKGEAINYQINSENKRILEVYNCLMTAYKVLNEEDQDEKRGEILSSLKTCMEGEVEFWLDQFKSDRPTDQTLLRTKNAYVDAYNKMASAFDELGIAEEIKLDYLKKFDNYFIDKANSAAVSSWKTTVGYNYYRDDFDNLGKHWNRTPGRKEYDTDYFRPSDNTLETFISETGVLVELLEFCVKQFNDKTLDIALQIYDNMIYLIEAPIDQWSYKPMVSTTTNGYGAVTEQYEYYELSKHLTEDSVETRRKQIRKLRADKDNTRVQIERRKKEEKEAKQKAKEEAIAKYWEAHPEEKAKMDHDLEMFQQKKDELNNKITQLDKEIESKKQERDRALPIEEEVKKQRRLVSDLEREKAACGLFKSKQKKAIQDRIDTIEKPKLKALREQADAESNAHFNKVNEEINGLINERGALCKGVNGLDAGMDSITLLINTKPFQDQ